MNEQNTSIRYLDISMVIQESLIRRLWHRQSPAETGEQMVVFTIGNHHWNAKEAKSDVGYPGHP